MRSYLFSDLHAWIVLYCAVLLMQCDFNVYLLQEDERINSCLCLCCSGGVDPPCCSPLAAGLPAFLLQPGDDGWSSAGLAQPHLEAASPVAGSASAHVPAALLVGAHTCLPVLLSCL